MKEKKFVAQTAASWAPQSLASSLAYNAYLNAL